MTSFATLMAPEECANAHPVGLRDRIPTLDTIRGLGVFGILVVNIQCFGLVSEARSLPTAMGDGASINRAIWFLTHVVADGKFMMLFSLLFGAGICLMSQRLQAEGASFAPIHFRRMGFLMAIGLLHAYLLWSGDILFIYGVCGCVCWFFRRSRPVLLFALGIATLAAGQFITQRVWAQTSGSFFFLCYDCFEKFLRIPPMPTPLRETLVYRGTWLQQMALRIPDALNTEFGTFWVVTFWRTCGAFLIGMGLFKLGFLGGRLKRVVYRGTLVAALVSVLISAISCYTCLDHGPVTLDSFTADFQLNYWLSVPIGLGWATLGILLTQLNGLRLLRAALQAVGRCAFTNYIMQTFICTTLFYGHGFGLFARLDRLQLMVVLALICTAQTVVSFIWTRVFAYGPLEWLVRSFAYGYRPEILLPAPNPMMRWLSVQRGASPRVIGSH